MCADDWIGKYCIIVCQHEIKGFAVGLIGHLSNFHHMKGMLQQSVKIRSDIFLLVYICETYCIIKKKMCEATASWRDEPKCLK